MITTIIIGVIVFIAIAILYLEMKEYKSKYEASQHELERQVTKVLKNNEEKNDNCNQFMFYVNDFRIQASLVTPDGNWASASCDKIYTKVSFPDNTTILYDIYKLDEAKDGFHTDLIKSIQKKIEISKIIDKM